MQVAEFSVSPLHAQVVAWDEPTDDFPLWDEDGAVSATETAVAVAARSDTDGDVTVRVHEGSEVSGLTVVLDGWIRLSGPSITVGNVTAGVEHRVTLTHGGTRRLRVYVDTPGAAATIAFVLPPSDSR